MYICNFNKIVYICNANEIECCVYNFSFVLIDIYTLINIQLMGLAVYNSIILDLRFPPCCYKKLLSPPVVPYNNPRATVGVTRLTLNDLKLVHPVCIGHLI